MMSKCAVVGACMAMCTIWAAASLAQERVAVAEDMPVNGEYAPLYREGAMPARSDPIRLQPGPQLFVDDYLIASSANVKRVVNQPVRDAAIPNPVVMGKEDGCFQPYMTVLRDESTGRFRIWYGHRTEDMSSSRSHIGYLESDDGVRWIRPQRVLNDPAPIQFGVSVIDEGAAFAPVEQRYKYAWYMDGGLKVAASPDGLVWTPLSPDPVLKHSHDITGIYRDPIRNRYIATISVYREGPMWSGRRRVTMQAFSSDLSHWDSLHYVLLPKDEVEPGETQFYAMDGYLARGGLLIGMVKVLRDDLKADDPPEPADAYGIGYTTLAWSRDGMMWYRDREPFLERNLDKSSWDHSHAWIDEQLPVGDEINLYYAGYAHGHKVNRFEERQIGLLKMKRDRYVAREAGAEEGRLVTPAIIVDGTGITVNADASKGSVRAQLLDENGQPIPGYTLDACTPITSDATSSPLTWAKPLAELRGKPIRIEFTLTNARLYAFDIT